MHQVLNANIYFYKETSITNDEIPLIWIQLHLRAITFLKSTKILTVTKICENLMEFFKYCYCISISLHNRCTKNA